MHVSNSHTTLPPVSDHWVPPIVISRSVLGGKWEQWVTPALNHYGRPLICLCNKEMKETVLCSDTGLSWVHYLIEWLLVGSAIGVKCGIVWVSVWVCVWVSEYIVYAVEWMSESCVYTIEWVSESWVDTIEWVYKYGVYAVDCVSECRVGADGCPAGHVETALLLPLTRLISETDCTPHNTPPREPYTPSSQFMPLHCGLWPTLSIAFCR